MHLSIGGNRLYVRDVGQGSPLLLVHGFPLDHQMWKFQIDGLSRDRRVIAPDLRGFGRSDLVDGELTMSGLADDLAGLLDALSVTEPVAFCGLSMGGYIAWEFWQRHGDRVNSLILCDTRAAADPPATARGRLESAHRVLDGELTTVVDGMLPKLFSSRTRADQPDVVASTRQVMYQTNPQTVASALRGLATRTDFEDRLREIRVPALVLCGEEDPISPPAEMRRIAEALGGPSQFAAISNAGHMAPVEQPQQVNQHLAAFLARC